MSEVKFSCPFCQQHVVCDESYCGARLDCPGCNQPIYVPGKSAFAPVATGKLTLSLPVAAKAAGAAPSAVPLDLWTEQEWERHTAEVTGESPYRTGLWLFLLLAPFPLALLLLSRGASPKLVGLCFIPFALGGGVLLARTWAETPLKLMWGSLVSSLLMLVAYVAIAGLVIMVGCVVL